MHRSGFAGARLHPNVELAAYGYVVARPETMKAAGKTFGFMRFAITDSGRTAIG